MSVGVYLDVKTQCMLCGYRCVGGCVCVWIRDFGCVNLLDGVFSMFWASEELKKRSFHNPST